MRTRALIEDRALGTVCASGAGHVGLMRQLPRLGNVGFSGGRNIRAMVHPAVPAGGNRGRLGRAVENYPAAGAAFGIRTAFIIDIAGSIFADPLAVAPGVKPGSQGLPVPPGENLKK